MPSPISRWPDGPHAANGPVAMPVVFTKFYGAGRVYYNALGHKAQVIGTGPAAELMRRGLIWARAAHVTRGHLARWWLDRRAPASSFVTKPCDPGPMTLPADHYRLTKRDLSLHELLADGIVHALALLAGLIAFPLLLNHALREAGVGMFAALAVYAAGFFLMWGFSLAYNMTPPSALKWLLRRFDHSMIYVMIAGTYTALIPHLDSGWGLGPGRGGLDRGGAGHPGQGGAAGAL